MQPGPDFLSSSSSDELSISLTEPRPDPMLGSFDEAGPGTAGNPRVDAEFARLEPGIESLGIREDDDNDEPGRRNEPNEANGGLSPGSYDMITGLEIHGPRLGRGPGAEGAIAASSTRANRGVRSRTPKPPTPAEEEDEGEGEGEEFEASGPRRLPWSTLILASYASAVTFGLIWVLWTGRGLPAPSASTEAEVAPAVEAPADPGLRADRTRKLAPRAPVPEAHTTTLGRSIQMGLIEITPLEIVSGPVRLERGYGSREYKNGGKDAIRLRLRLRNLSNDTVIAPFDEAFVRERPRADPETLVECGPDTSPIAMYPLALESEWSIQGQTFRDLRPGEELITDVVTMPDAFRRITPSMIWRVRLRTDLNFADDLGVRFRADEIVRKP